MVNINYFLTKSAIFIFISKDLGLSSEDMEIMLKYIGKDPNVVTKDELKKAMGVTLD